MIWKMLKLTSFLSQNSLRTSHCRKMCFANLESSSSQPKNDIFHGSRSNSLIVVIRKRDQVSSFALENFLKISYLRLL